MKRRNRVICLGCGTILESKFRHDFQACDCPNETFVDGGQAYFRRGGMDLSLIEELPVHEEIDITSD